MTGPREPEGLHPRTIWFAAAVTVALTLAVTGVAWLFVTVPRGSPAASRPSSLRHELFDRARDGADSRATATHELERYEWIDRAEGIVRIPIEQAMEAASTNPTLIGVPSAEVAR